MLHALNPFAARYDQGQQFSRSSTQQQARVGDELTVSARSKRVALKSEGATGVEDSHQGRGFEKAARHLVKKAVRAITRDIGQMFQSLGFDKQAGRSLAKSLTQPVMDALRSGADFTAQIKMMALNQVTKISGDKVSQDLFLVAKSIEIDVNHTTGEVSVETASLKLQQSVSAEFQPVEASGFALPALDDLLPDAIKDLLAGAGTGAGAQEPAAAASQDEQLVEALAKQGDNDAGEADDDDADDGDERGGIEQAAAGREGLGELRGRGALDERDDDRDDDDDDDDDRVAAVGPAGTAGQAPGDQATGGSDGVGTVQEQLQTRIRVRAVQSFSNDLGQFVTRVRLDAAINLSRITSGDQSFLQSARAEIGAEAKVRGSFLSLRA